jgi:hypothetical protein
MFRHTEATPQANKSQNQFLIEKPSVTVTANKTNKKIKKAN